MSPAPLKIKNKIKINPTYMGSLVVDQVCESGLPDPTV